MASLIRRFALSCRDIKLRKKRKGIKQSDVSIISNNCTGGVIYKDVKLKFLSPTINLYFGNDGKDFLVFMKHLKEYVEKGFFSKSDLKETRTGFENSPIAYLEAKGLPKLEIHFMHYDSYEEAVNKWNERSKRINYNKIFLAIELKEEKELGLIDDYLALPYPKVIFAPVKKDGIEIYGNEFYKKYGTGEKYPILKLVSIFGKRGYDSYDFINNIFNYDYLGGK